MQKHLKKARNKVNKHVKKVKKVIKDPFNWLRIFVGSVFILAASFRILYFSNAQQEMAALNMPEFMIFFIILFELVIGALLVTKKFVKVALILISIFLSFAVVWGFIIYLPSFPANLGRAFVYNADPTDIFLHFTYLVLAIFLFFKTKK